MWTYSVMQSDGNSFFLDVVLNSFNKASREEENILYQVFKSKYDPKIFAFHIFGLKCCLYLYMPYKSFTRRHLRKNYLYLIASHCKLLIKSHDVRNIKSGS